MYTGSHKPDPFHSIVSTMEQGQPGLQDYPGFLVHSKPPHSQGLIALA